MNADLNESTASQDAEQFGFVSGHDFSRAVKVSKTRALAPEVRFFMISRATSLGNGSKKPNLSG
jgi:hypothetical protein